MHLWHGSVLITGSLDIENNFLRDDGEEVMQMCKASFCI